jgi:hypothetical protein
MYEKNVITESLAPRNCDFFATCETVLQFSLNLAAIRPESGCNSGLIATWLKKGLFFSKKAG